jgi:2-octaprenyl-6-methoxyphenol hydroxylase
MLHTDIMVVGGGVAGFSLTALLAQAGLSVICVDRAPLADRIDKNRDGRAQALSAATCRVLDSIGAWSLMAPHAAAITDIAILDADAPVALNFLSREIGDQAFGQNIDITIIRSCLAQILGYLPTATVMAPAAAVGFRAEAASIVADLEDGRQVRAKLLVAADGRESPLRQMAGIGVTRWTYDQQAIVCAMHHETPHDGRALEHFFPEGPFAVLPLSDGPDGVFRSSVVWTTKPAIAAAMMDVNDTEFTAALQEKCGERLGRIALVPGRWCYPLGVHHAHHYIAPRLVLVGDAAHAMHPIAGQGLNIGFRDVAALTELVAEAYSAGADVGSAALLARYQAQRRPDALMMIGATHVLEKLFGNDVGPVRWARRLGIAAVDRIPGLKRAFARQAMGLPLRG